MKRLLDRRVYLDANIFIYFLGRHPSFIDAVTPVFEAAYRGDVVAVTGEVAVAEVMVGPYRTRDVRVIRDSTEFFETRNLLDIRGHGYAEFDDAARLRAELRISLIDALHLATARRARCDYLLTNDARLPSIPGVTVVPLDSLVSE